MSKIYSITLCIIPLLFARFCSIDGDIDNSPKTIKVVLHTVDHFGNSVVSADLTYQQLDCEYDFTNPLHTNTNKDGYGVLNLEPGYLQIFDTGFLRQSYLCTTITEEADTLTLYAAPVPTFIEVKNECNEPIGYATLIYFSNQAGDCIYESNVLDHYEIKTDVDGKAIIYLPFQDTYKLQIETNGVKEIKCFQPSQQPETLEFLLPC